MKKSLMLILIILTMGLFAGLWATTLLDPTGDGGFETGATFANNGWTDVSGTQTNKNYVGTYPTVYAGSRCSYTSNSASAWTGTASATYVHMYRDITFPAGETAIKMDFYYKILALDAGYDGYKIFFAETSFTPTAGSLPTGTQVGNTWYDASTSWTASGSISIPSSYAGTTKRLIITWRNDGVSPAGVGAIDNIRVTSMTPVPMTGTWTINPDGSGGTNFTTFTAAINYLNDNGVGTGGVTFNVEAGKTFTENTPTISATGTSANQIIFQKSGTGANPIVRPSTAAGSTDAGIRVDGGDYFTFDGIDVTHNSQALEYGYWFNALSGNGCKYNTVKNCNVTIQNGTSSSYAIYTSSSSTSGGSNDYNKFYSIVVDGATQGYRLYGNSSYLDVANEVGVTGSTNTTISNVKGTAVYMYYQSGGKVFNQTIQTPANTANFRGIDIAYGSGDVYNNTINGFGTGAAYVQNGIYVSGTSSTTTSNIYNNTIQNFNTTSLSGYGIYVSSSSGTALNIYGNTVQTFSGTGAGSLYGAYISSGTAVNLYNNTITGLSNSSGTVYGIALTGGSNNQIYRNKVYALTYSGTSTYVVYGILQSSGTSTIYNNLVYDLRAATAVGSATNPSIRGIALEGGTADNVYYNSVYLSNTSTALNSWTAGLYMNSSPTTITLNNNIIVNNCTIGTNATPTGIAAAIWKVAAGWSNVATSSGRNIYYASGSADAKHLIAYEQTTPLSYQTMASYRTAVSPRDAASYTQNPFTGTTDLTITGATYASNSGTPISGIGYDYTGTTARDASTPDIGAYEGSYSNIELAPAATTTVLPTGSSVLTTTSFSWNASWGATAGIVSDYKFYLRKDTQAYGDAGTINGTLMGNVLTYTPAADLAASQLYYWKVVATNAYGDAVGTAESSFTTTLAALAGEVYVPAGYATIAAAVTALNNYGVGAGGVNINVAAGHTETLTAKIILTATGTTTKPIVFRKDPATSGANPLITAYVGTATPASASPDGMWVLAGADYVTIDGIDLYDPNSTNPATMEYGFALCKASVTDGAQYNTIKNSVITLSRVNNAAGTAPMVDGSVGINMINCLVGTATTAVTPTAASGTNSNNKFYNNTIQNVNTGIALYGYAASSPYTLGDTGNDVGGASVATANQILNYGGGGTATAAVGIRATNQWGVNLSYNTVNNNNGSGVNHAAILYGIWAESGTNANATINGNTVTVNGGGTTQTIYAINSGIGSSGSTNTVSINNNNISATYSTATTGAFTGINNTATANTLNINSNTFSAITLPGSGAASFIYNAVNPVSVQNINNNTFTNLSLATTGNVNFIYNNSSTPSITVTGNAISGTFAKTGAGGTIYGYYNNGSPGSGTSTLSSNNFSGITLTGATAFYGINNTTATGQITIVSNNTYSNITGGSSTIYGINSTYSAVGGLINGNTITNWTGTGAMYGINMGSSDLGVSVYDNNINGLVTTGAATVYGIYAYATTLDLYKNKIYGLSADNAGGAVYGIYTGGGTTLNIYNNLIGSLTTPSANAACPLVGLYISGGTTVNAYYNTIYLNGASSTATLFGSSAVYATATPTTVNLRNNIFVNTSSNVGATGFTTAYRRASAVLTNYATTSNNNLFYAGTGTNNLVMYDGTNSYTTLAAYKSAVGPTRDAASFSENASFLSTAGSSSDFLKINTSTATQIESGAVNITGFTTDYATTIRQGNTGYLGTSIIGPDCGAFEGEYTPGIPTTTPGGQPTTLALVPASTTMSGTFTPSATTPLAEGYLVVRYTASPVVTNPTNGVPSPAVGTALGAGFIVANVGSGSFTDTGAGLSGNVLTVDTDYWYVIFPYRTTGVGGPIYNVSGTLLSGTQRTLIAAPLPPATLTASVTGSTSVALAATANAAVNDIIVVYNTTNTFGTLLSSVNYTTGTTVTGGGTVWYNGVATGLTAHNTATAGTTYYYKAYSVAPSGSYYVYSTGLASTPSSVTTYLSAPYSENFNASTSMPTGWSGDMACSASHGASGTNGIYYNLDSSPALFTETTPIVGSIPANYRISFDYRLVNYSSYPSTATVLGAGNTYDIQVSIDGGTNYTTLYTINSTNHVTSLNFATLNIPLPSATVPVGSNVKVRFNGVWASGDMYFDVDNFSINEIPPMPVIGILPTSADFGLKAENSTNSTNITLYNSGSVDMVVSSISVASPFSCTYSGTIAAGGNSGPIALNYNPTTTGVSSATVTVNITGTFGGTNTMSVSGQAYPADYTVESFESATFPPADWSATAVTNNNWASSSTAYAGTKAAYLSYYSTPSYTYEASTARLKTTLLQVPNDNLYFYARSGSDAASTLKVQYSADGTTGWTDLATINLTTTYTLQTISLSSIVGQYYLGFYGTTAATYNGYVYLDNVIMPAPVPVIPGVATLVTPANVVTPTIASPVTLTWAAGTGHPTAYDVYFGTDNPPLTRVSELQTGLTYAPTTAYNTTYYWQIVPHTSVGYASNCPVWTFRTADDPIIYSFPYTQNWDTTTAPNFWTVYGSGAATITLSTTSPYNGTYSALFNNSSEATPTKYLVSPQINADIDLTEGFRVGFYAKGETATNTVIIGTTDATMATFTPFGSPITLTTSWAFYEVDMSTYTGTDNHIAFKTTHAATYDYNYIDNIQFYVVPATPSYTVTPTSKDFGSLDLTVSSYQTFVIQNVGLASLSLSDITLSNTVGTAFSLARVPSPLPSLAYRDTTSFVVKFNPTTAGSKAATVTVVDNMARASHTVSLTGSGLAPISIATTPYTENFDGSAPYSVSVSPDAAWVIGTPAKVGSETYPAQIVGPKSTPNAIVTRSLTDFYTDSDASTVTLPTISLGDFPSGVVVSFWHNFFTEAGWDAGVLEYSTDMGANWVKADATLGTGGNFNTTVSQNWYNSSSSSGPVAQPKWSGTSTAYTGHAAGWIQSGTFISRTTLGSATTVKFRFRWGTDGSGVRDGWAIDDIQVQKQPVTEYAITNLATTQLYKIANEAVAFSARVTNNGYITTGTNINLKVGEDVVATIPTGTINFGSYKDVTFSYIFPAGGTYNLSAVLDTDENLANNTSNTLSSVFVYGVNQLAEGFEGTFAPDRWATWTTPAWYQASTGYLDGAKCAALDVAISEAGTRYLSTPPVVVTTGSTLSFYASASDTTLQIQMKYHAGYESGTDPSTWTWTALGLPIALTATYPVSAISVDLSSLAEDTYYFAFTGIGAATTGTIRIDNVVGPAKFIPLVTPLKAGFVGPTGEQVDPKTVVLDWTAPGEPGGTPEFYSVFYGESESGVGDNQLPDVVHPNTSTKPYDLAPRVTLKYNTVYYWEVVPTLTLADPMSPTPDIWTFRTKSQISAGDLSIGTIAPTEQKTGTISIQNIGDAELTFSVTDCPAELTFSGPYTIPANSTIALAYTFTAPGNTSEPYSDTFTITQTAAPHSSKEIAVTATVTNPSGVTIGTGTSSSSYAPLYYNYDYSWSRMIYTKSEINTAGLSEAGNINSISFYVTSTLDNSVLGDQRIYLRGTSDATETTSYVDPLTNGFTECYVGELAFNGPGWYQINLTTPFNWDNNSNIEVAWENHDGDYSDNDAISFYGTSTSANYRTVYKYQDSEFPSTLTGTTIYTRPNIQFSIPAVSSGSMSGYVTSGARAAVAGATVSIGGTALSTTTNAAGRYNFTAVPEGTYTVTCSKTGYYNLEHSVTITNNVTTTRDFAIVLLPNINITGHVIGNDSAPVVGAAVSFVGPTTLNTTTNDSGDFTFTGVAGDTNYNYTISKSGFTAATGSVTVSTSNYNAGTITMNEVAFPTYTVSAAESGSDVVVSWTAAGPPPVQTYDFESSNGGFTATSWTTTGWSWGTSANHGSHSGSKVWGCMLSGNYGVTGTQGVYGYYELVSPTIDLYSGASLSFWHKYYFEGTSTFFDGGRVQVSTDNGINWTTITPNGGYPCADISSFGDGTFPGYGNRNDTNWSQATFSLSAYANHSVKIKWQMAVDYSVAYLGWTIDDVSVTTASRGETPTKITALGDRSLIGYNVYRFAVADEATPAAWTKIADSIEPTTTYTDTEWSTLPGGSYKWAVEAIYSGGTLISVASKSNEVYHLTAPTGLTAVLDGGNIHLTWTADAQATGYKVYCSDDPNADFASWILLATVLTNSYDYTPVDDDPTVFALITSHKHFKIVTVKSSRNEVIGATGSKVTQPEKIRRNNTKK